MIASEPIVDCLCAALERLSPEYVEATAAALALAAEPWQDLGAIIGWIGPDGASWLTRLQLARWLRHAADRADYDDLLTELKGARAPLWRAVRRALVAARGEIEALQH